jgi:plastocyanin/cytochrome c553
MTDAVEPPPPPEERLPATRPPERVSAERFTAAPSLKAIDGLTPERSAGIVRQSSSARWVGFLTVCFVTLFIVGYWFYELGAPLGISEARLAQEIEQQQVTAVERGYNVYQANCARCHGVNGEGGIGPALNRQDKLFAHLNENYLRQVLNAGGRYVCGNSDSQMPVWADTANPPGPLNYIAVGDLIAFIRAPSNQEFVIRDPDLLEPEHDPITGEVRTFTGWVDPNYKPDAGATPYPDCWTDEFEAGASAAPSGSASAVPSGGSPAASVSIVASGIAFTTTTVTAPANVPFVIAFDNQDAGVPHNVTISDASGAEVFKGEIFPGVETRDYQVPALAAGEYPFVCTVHPTMTGTLTAE